MSQGIWKIAVWTLAGVLGASPMSGQTPTDENTGKHWSFVPVQRPVLPVVRGTAATAVDRFILAKLEAKGLTLNPEADRPTLIRRASFDLTGLPPYPRDIGVFVNDRSPDAYEKMLERLLASPHYGERWGKHWLDAAGYADSNGYFNADSDRPLAWRYRDYVVRAFSMDKPYDRFVTEQIAGDELAGYKPGGDVTPAAAELLIATHFLRNAPDGTGESDGNPDEVRTDRYTVLEGNLQNLMNCLMGVTIQCARCHRHKFEPITQREYYGLQAIFFPVYNPERWTKPNERVVEAGTRTERLEWRQRNQRIDQQVKALQTGLAAFAKSLRAQVLDERLQYVPAAERDKILQAVETPKEKRTKSQESLLKTHGKAAAVTDDDLARRFAEYVATRRQVQEAVRDREKDRPPPLVKIAAYVETDPKPAKHHLLRRGQHNRPGDEVQPGVPAAFCSSDNSYGVSLPPAGQLSTGRRTALARWLTSPQNPLLPRVMINRIWQHHFGTGLVATPDNLGQSGARPTHPELLDFLAAGFIRSGWSIKAMHRLIMRSAVYRQTSTSRPDLIRIDADNRLLGRFPLHRLDAEAIRDSMLSVAAELDARFGGAYVPTRLGAEGVEVAENQPGARRRSLYLQQRRTQVMTLLQIFDAPAIVATCGLRSTSTVPLQSLALLNSDFARARARGFARRLFHEAGPATETRLNLAFQLTCARSPAGEESSAALRFLEKQQQTYAGRADGAERAWTDFCQMLLASNSFLYVE